jgi:hypothetical protein
MKQTDIKVGEQYGCRVSGVVVRVTVLSSRDPVGVRARTVYQCRNERTGRLVTKTAAALHPLKKRTAEQDMSAMIAAIDIISI